MAARDSRPPVPNPPGRRPPARCSRTSHPQLQRPGAEAAENELTGARHEGTIPNVPRLVAIVAPHTASWDFMVGLAGS
jgi:hypothetical protein